MKHVHAQEQGIIKKAGHMKPADLLSDQKSIAMRLLSSSESSVIVVSITR